MTDQGGIADDARPRRARAMAWQTIDGETVLLNIAAGELHGINEVAARIWSLCDGAHTVGEIAAGIADEFDIDVATARSDLGSFLSSLKAAGAVEL